MARFLDSLRTIGYLIEATPYTATANASVNYQIRAYNVKYSPEIEEFTRKYAVSHWGAFESIMGKRSVKVSFSIDMDWSAAAVTAPRWFGLCQACSMVSTTFGTTGISVRSSSQHGNVPITLWIQDIEEGTTPRSIGIQTSGAMGNWKMVGEGVGKPVRLDFEFVGALASLADQTNANTRTPTGFDTTLPEVMLGTSITAYGDTLQIDKFELDLGNVIELETDLSKANGVLGAHVVDRKPTLKVDPYMHLLTTSGALPQDFFTRWTASTTGALVINVGTNLHVLAPAVQVLKAYNPGERGRMVSNNMELGFARDTTNGDYGIEILQGAKA